MPEKITIGEIKEVIKAEGVSPSDLFSLDALMGDSFIKGFVNEATKETQGKLRGEAEQRRRGEEGLDKKAKEMEDDGKKKDDLIKKLQIDGAKRDAIGIFDTKIKERKLDKQCSAFIKSKQGAFIPEDPEALDKEVDVFLDSGVKEFKETAKIFGHKTEEKEDEPKGGSEPGEGAQSEDNAFVPD